MVLAQSRSTEYRTDINGNRTANSSTALDANGNRTLMTKGPDGRDVPLEKSESRVISEGPDGKVVETIVKRYGTSGQVVVTERTVTDEQKRPDGSSVVNSTLYRGDPNGNMQLSQKSVVETKKQGNTNTTDEVISRAAADGRLQPVEKRSVVTTGDITKDASSHQDEQVFRLNSSGQFYQAAHNTVDENKTGDKTTSQVAHFEPDITGRLALESQKVITTSKAADGSEVQDVTVYGKQPTRSSSDNAANSLLQQETTVRKKGADGSVTETTSVRQVSPSDPNRLGAPVVVSQTVCTGSCGTAPTSPKAVAPPQATAAPAPTKVITGP